jgi:hypothetical protein
VSVDGGTPIGKEEATMALDEASLVAIALILALQIILELVRRMH